MEPNLKCLPNDAIHYLGLVEKTMVFCSWMRCPKLMLCSTTADLSGCSRQICYWCSFNLVSTERPVCPMQTWQHSQGMLYTPGVLSSRSSLTGRRKLDIFLGGRPTDLMLCQASTLLMRFNIDPTQGRKVTESGFPSV
jgi:hypothetical protein